MVEMSDINEKVSVALPVESVEDIVGYLKELVKFVAYENTIYNPFYTTVDVQVLLRKIEYLEELVKNNEQDLNFEKNNN